MNKSEIITILEEHTNVDGYIFKAAHQSIANGIMMLQGMCGECEESEAGDDNICICRYFDHGRGKADYCSEFEPTQ